MDTLITIIVFFIAFSMGSTGSIICAATRQNKPVVRIAVACGVIIPLIAVICLAPSRNGVLAVGITIGFIIGLFMLSLCIASKESNEFFKELEERELKN